MAGIWQRIFNRKEGKSTDDRNAVAPGIVSMDNPVAGALLMQRFRELKEFCRPLSDGEERAQKGGD